MRFKYWTIQVVPDPVRIGTVGAGVIVVDPNSMDVRARVITNERRLPREFIARKGVHQWLRDLESRINHAATEQTRLELDRAAGVDAYVARLARQMNNVIRIDPPRFASGRSIDQLTDFLFDQFIGPESSEVRATGLRSVRRKISEEYGAHESVARILRVQPSLYIGHRQKSLDFAVAGEEGEAVYELTQAFSFTGEPNSGVRDKIESWTWGIDTLRSRGGKLEIAGENQLQLGKSATVIAVIEPPVNEAQQLLYEAATAEWESLGIRQVRQNDLRSHVNHLESKIRSA